MSLPQTKPVLKKFVSRLIWSTGLQDALFRYREAQLTRAAPAAVFDEQGRPLPPAHLRVLVIGTADPQWFIENGQKTVTEFDEILSATGGGFATASEVLDIGCGCGRLARWVLRLNPNVNGVDINPKLVDWCRKNLPGTWKPCDLHQPIPAADASFALAYACSVITHLREATAAAWLHDVARVLKPGGRLLLTFHDEEHRHANDLRDQLSTGYAVKFDSLEGSNHLAAFVTLEKLQQLAADAFELLHYVPSGATHCGQAISIWRKV
jgi:SAM-dependent methyltransferase